MVQIPVQNAPVQIPIQNVPLQNVTSQNIPAQNIPAQSIPSPNIPPQNVPPQSYAGVLNSGNMGFHMGKNKGPDLYNMIMKLTQKVDMLVSENNKRNQGSQ